jgi:hypothetical protein
MKAGDLVKWRNSKEQAGCHFGQESFLDESWFHYAVVIGIEDHDEGDLDKMVTVLFEGHIFNIPESILSPAEDPDHTDTIARKQARLYEELDEEG